MGTDVGGAMGVQVSPTGHPRTVRVGRISGCDGAMSMVDVGTMVDIPTMTGSDVVELL